MISIYDEDMRGWTVLIEGVYLEHVEAMLLRAEQYDWRVPRGHLESCRERGKRIVEIAERLLQKEDDE